MKPDKYVHKAIDKFDLNIKNIQNVPESYSSKVYKLTLEQDYKVILKIPYNISKYKREINALKILEDRLPVPKLVDHYTSSDYGMMLLSYIDGEPIEGPISKRLAYDMGELLASLHINKTPRFGDLTDEETSYDSWWKFMQQLFYNYKPYCSTVIAEEELNQYETTFNLLYERLPEADGPCLVHMDYRPGNILINNGRISGLIDFETLRGGSSDIDLTKIKHYVWDRYEGTQREFLAGYSSIRKIPDIDRSIPFYEFANAFSSIGWCIKRNKLNDKFLKENLQRLRQLNKQFTNSKD